MIYPAEFKNLAQKAVEYIKDGMIVSLGTGRTASAMIHELGNLVQNGLKIQAVPTSKASQELAEHYQIPLVRLNEIQKIDLAIDGVDEMDPDFNAIKGGGGALYREKINVLMSDRVIWIMTSQKRVQFLGAYPLPIEVQPYALNYVMDYLNRTGIQWVLRKTSNNSIFLTENQNYMIDLHLQCIKDPAHTYTQLKNISGVLEAGLFVNLCDTVIVSTLNGVEVIENSQVAKPMDFKLI